MATRRQFLMRTGVAGGMVLAQRLPQSAPVNGADSGLKPDMVQFRPDIEPTVRLIEDTPQEQCFDMVVDQLRRGLPYRRFLAALFLAGIRNVSPQPPGFKFHCVFVIQAAHQMSMDLPMPDRLLPLFWALDNFKQSQAKDVQEGDFRLSPVRGRIPADGTAWSEFHAAMQDWDEERADRAIVGLVRTRGASEIMDQLWQYGARDFRNIGHKAIFTANAWRTLQTIGWQHAEPVLRSLVLGLLDFGRDEQRDGYGFENQCYLSNAELVQAGGSRLRGDWTGSSHGRQAAADIVDAMHSGAAPDVCQTVLSGVLGDDSRTSAVDIWDAVHLAGAELMMRQPGIYGIHTVTSASALRYAFNSAGNAETRLLLMLQAVGWLCQFRTFMSAKEAGLNETRITRLTPVEIPGDAALAAESIFADIGRNPVAAAGKTLSFAIQHGQSDLVETTARAFIARKATDAHDYKYPVAVFEDAGLVSAHWRPNLLAAAAYHVPGSATPDSPLLLRATAAIRSLGGTG